MPFLSFSFRVYAGLPPIRGDVLSSSPQGPVFTATSSLPSAVEDVNFPCTETSIGPFFPGFDPIADSDALSEAGSVDMDRLDLGISFPALPLRSGPLVPAIALGRSSFFLLFL